MAIPLLRFAYEGQALFSPFSGKPLLDQAEEYSGDDTLLFFFVGDVNEYAYLSPKVEQLLTQAGAKQPSSEMEPAEILKALAIPSAIAFEVDSGWNGVNTIAWAPSD